MCCFFSIPLPDRSHTIFVILIPLCISHNDGIDNRMRSIRSSLDINGFHPILQNHIQSSDCELPLTDFPTGLSNHQIIGQWDACVTHWLWLCGSHNLIDHSTDCSVKCVCLCCFFFGGGGGRSLKIRLIPKNCFVHITSFFKTIFQC